MFVIEIAPLTKNSKLGNLTYYSSEDLSEGSLVTIPLRSREVMGVVLSSTAVSMAKTAIRAATFSLRKLPEQKDRSTLPSLIVSTAKDLCKSTPASFSSILFSLLPPEIRRGDEPPMSFEKKEYPGENSVSLLTELKAERLLIYKRRIREAFAHSGSVIFVAPTFEAAVQAYDKLTGGIEDRSVFLGSLPKKALRKAYKNIEDLSGAKLIITTPSRAFIDRPDVSDVIIDESASGYFRVRTRPYLDLKEALLVHSKLAGRRVMLGELVHRSEDEHKRRSEIYQTEGEEPHRLNLDSQLRVIKQKDKPTADEPFELIGKQLMSAIEMTLKAKKKVFLYAARRGLAPVVACGDCGYIFRCPDSGTPYSLFRTFKDGEEKRWFLSSVSGRRVRAADVCPECNSWRLRERGIGIQYIQDELTRQFPEEKIFVLDHSTAPTATKARSVMGEFYDQKGAILIGTSKALTYAEKPFATSAIVSLDAVRSIPTWRVDEATFSLLLKLRELTAEKVFIQTRTEPDELLNLASSGSVEKFFDEELSLRKSLNYPPFSHIVHITISGQLEAVREMEADITPILEKFEFFFYSSPDSLPEKTIRYGICRVLDKDWPKEDLMEILRTLPPAVRVEINPDRIV